VNAWAKVMDDMPGPAPRGDRVSIKRPLGHRGLETLAAHYVRQTFKPHSHPQYLIGVITGGVHSVWCRGERHTVLPGTVMSMRPGDVHHGNAAIEAGWVQRMFYVDPRGVAEDVVEADGDLAGVHDRGSAGGDG